MALINHPGKMTALRVVLNVKEIEEQTAVRQKLTKLKDKWNGLLRSIKQGRVELDGTDFFDDVVNHRIDRMEAQYDQMTQDIIAKEEMAREQGDDVDEETFHNERIERAKVAGKLKFLQAYRIADHNDQDDDYFNSNESWWVSGQGDPDTFLLGMA